MYKKSIGLRVVAFLIDIITIMLLGITLNVLFGFGTMTTSGFGFDFNLNFFEATGLAIVYFGLIEYILYGQSVGKLVVRIQVTNENLEKLEDRKIYLFRGALKGLLVIISIISFLFVIIREDRKSIHDLAFKTLVIKEFNEKEIMTKNNE